MSRAHCEFAVGGVRVGLSFLLFYTMCAWFCEDLVMSVDVLNEPCPL